MMFDCYSGKNLFRYFGIFTSKETWLREYRSQSFFEPIQVRKKGKKGVPTIEEF